MPAAMRQRRRAQRRVERARGDMPEGRIGARYLMREKIFAVGDDFYVENEHKQRVFKIDGKAFRVRDTLKFEDLKGNEIYKIRERKVRVRDSMNIYRGGDVAAKVHNALITPLRDRFKIEVPGKPDLTTKGNILYHEYMVEREGTPIAVVSRKWFTIRNTYGVEVADAEDALLVLAITVCIDMFS